MLKRIWCRSTYITLSLTSLKQTSYTRWKIKHESKWELFKFDESRPVIKHIFNTTVRHISSVTWGKKRKELIKVFLFNLLQSVKRLTSERGAERPTSHLWPLQLDVCSKSGSKGLQFSAYYWSIILRCERLQNFRECVEKETEN